MATIYKKNVGDLLRFEPLVSLVSDKTPLKIKVCLVNVIKRLLIHVYRKSFCKKL